MGRIDKRLFGIGSALVLLLAIGGILGLAQGGSSAGDRFPEGPPVTANASASLVREGKDLPVASQGDPADRDGPRWVSDAKRIQRHEIMPCTVSGEPVNFKVFSAGPSVAGVPVTSIDRRCDTGAYTGEIPENDFVYIYGECRPAPDIGCLPPLQIRSYPACQRTFADYSFEGKPLPYKELGSVDGAKVREINFLADRRIEVYSGNSTIAISAADWSLAKAALKQLGSQPTDRPPATSGPALKRAPHEGLEPPVTGSMRGELPCNA